MHSATRTFNGRIYVFLLDDLHTASTRTKPCGMRPSSSSSATSAPTISPPWSTPSGRQGPGQELTSSPRLLTGRHRRVSRGRSSPRPGRSAGHALRQTDNDTVLADELQEPYGKALEEAGSHQGSLRRGARAQTRAARYRPSRTSRTGCVTSRGGAKALLLFSEGLDYGIYQPFNLTQSASANVTEARKRPPPPRRANVNIYGIDPRGLNRLRAHPASARGLTPHNSSTVRFVARCTSCGSHRRA